MNLSKHLHLLIYGPRKGGTTLLQSLVDGHLGILSFPGEFKIKELYKLFDTRDPIKWQEKYLNVLNTTYNNVSGENQDLDIINKKIDLPQFFNELKFCLKEATSIKEAVEIESILFSKYLKKTPKWIARKEVGGNTESVIYLFKILFPESKIIMITRNPKWIISSIIRDRKKKNISMSIGLILKEFWEAVKTNKRIELIDSLHIGTLRIKYENLINDPKSVMNNISEFLEIPYEDILTIPTTLGENIQVKTSSIKTREVVKTQNKWTDNLTLKEIVVIYFSWKLINFIKFKYEKK